MGLDRPFLVQVVRFFGSVLRGDLGTDVVSNRSVGTIVLEALPYTLALAVSRARLGGAGRRPARLLSAAVSAAAGSRPLAGVLSVGTIAMPSFVVAIYSAPGLRRLAALAAGDRGR